MAPKKVKEDVESDSSSDDEMPPLEGDEKAKQNRSEKKSRKAISKLGLQAVPGILRVTVKKSKSVCFVISKPDVFKSPASDTYVVFGEARVEDLGAQQQQTAAQQFAPDASVDAMKSEPKIEELEEDLDAGSLEEKDIELVMSQVQCTRGP